MGGDSCEIKWLMQGDREGLALVFDVGRSDYERDRVKSVPTSDSTPWHRLLGFQVTKMGAAWHEPTSGISAIWAIRLTFGAQGSVVIALGEWRDDALRYIL